jgi:UDP-N-acetylmuramoyl-L-alanyl-D-glutamate--2,6-diaminopimelate ligase
MLSITADSRNVTRGDTFVAIRGSVSNGEDFIEQAIQNGAAEVVVSNSFVGPEIAGARYIYVEEPRQYFAQQVALQSGAQPSNIVAVTGTNGKTSTVSFYKQICALDGVKSATLGTVGIDTSDRLPTGLLDFPTTSPDPVSLHRNLAILQANGYEHIALEASSHGLHQYRLDGLKFKAAAFTNFSQDHLDYHGSMDNYFKSKQRLFLDLLATDGVAIINADDEYGRKLQQLCIEKGIKTITFGVNPKADFRLDLEAVGLCFWHQEQKYTFPFEPIGNFQRYNVLAALLLAFKTGIDIDAIHGEFSQLVAPGGRLQQVQDKSQGQRQVFVDYAHTPDALEKALLALKPQLKEKGRLIVVFGCGGDRDTNKRPLMGKVAEQYADLVYVTDDNPRTEPAAKIRAEIMQAVPGALEIPDRAKAIAQAIKDMGSQDVLLIAGKGHEDYQIIGREKVHFSDVEEAEKAMC